jgi:hypothetical protein
MPDLLANPARQDRTVNLPARETRIVRRFDAPSLTSLWHLASFDAPTVAVVWSLAFARAANIHLPAWVPILLALGTWSVYVGDRMLDARNAIRSADLSHLRERHYFHWHRRRVLIPLAGAAAAVCAIIIFTEMPVANRDRGAALAFAALAYFAGVHLPRQRGPRRLNFLSKEFLVGVLFTAGCAMPTLLRLRPIPGPDAQLRSFPIVFAFFAALAWLNCHAIERWESHSSSPIATQSGFLVFSGLLLALILHHTAPGQSALLATGSLAALLLALLDDSSCRLTPLALRVAADLVLLTPILLLMR